MTRNQQNTNQVLQAIRLGWLSVETFGRLRHWAKTGREPSGSKGDAMRRFNFSDRDPSQYHQLMIALEQLHTASTQLLPKVPSPIPQHPEELLQRAKEDIDEVWLEFEKWSREIWIALQVENPLAGRAFTYGGSLADTYWHAEGAGLDQLPGLLRAQRLENIATRFNSLYRSPTHPHRRGDPPQPVSLADCRPVEKHGRG